MIDLAAAWLSERFTVRKSGRLAVRNRELRRLFDRAFIAVPEDEMCKHQPRCPDALALDCKAARVTIAHPEQGWSLLCNGVVLFEDAGALLPSGREVAPPVMGSAVTCAAPAGPVLTAIAA